MTAKRIAGQAPDPSLVLSPTIRNTGISASRVNPIAFGIVHGFSGAPLSVCGGGGRPLQRQRPRLPPAADLRLDLAAGDRALADGQPQRDTQELRVRELRAR